MIGLVTSSPVPLTAGEVFAEAKENEGWEKITQVTVYKHLEGLIQRGVVQATKVQGKKLYSIRRER